MKRGYLVQRLDTSVNPPKFEDPRFCLARSPKAAAEEMARVVIPENRLYGTVRVTRLDSGARLDYHAGIDYHISMSRVVDRVRKG